MVVVHAQPSSSATAQKKNRRKITRKKPQLGASSGDHGEYDEPMGQPQDGSGNITEKAAGNADDDEVMIDVDESSLVAQSSAPAFPPLPASAQRTTLKSEMRRVPIPPHRMTPLKKDWVNIFSPLTEMLQLQVRMNVQRRSVEIRVSSCNPGRLFIHFKDVQTSKHTKDIGALQKGADFVKSYALGFDVNVSFDLTPL